MGIAGGRGESSALIVLLGVVGLGRTAFGVLLVLAYGAGMAAADRGRAGAGPHSGSLGLASTPDTGPARGAGADRYRRAGSLCRPRASPPCRARSDSLSVRPRCVGAEPASGFTRTLRERVRPRRPDRRLDHPRLVSGRARGLR